MDLKSWGGRDSGNVIIRFLAGEISYKCEDRFETVPSLLWLDSCSVQLVVISTRRIFVYRSLGDLDKMLWNDVFGLHDTATNFCMGAV